MHRSTDGSSSAGSKRDTEFSAGQEFRGPARWRAHTEEQSASHTYSRTCQDRYRRRQASHNKVEGEKLSMMEAGTLLAAKEVERRSSWKIRDCADSRRSRPRSMPVPPLPVHAVFRTGELGCVRSAIPVPAPLAGSAMPIGSDIFHSFGRYKDKFRPSNGPFSAHVPP